MNAEQVKSIVRWFSATIGPFLISHGYISAGNLELAGGVVISIAPLIWSMFVHTQTNAVAVVDTIAKQPDSPVKAIITEPTQEGRALAASLPGTTTVVAGTTVATNIGKAA